MDKLFSDSAKTEISQKSWIFSGYLTFQNGILNTTTRAKILLNGGTGQPNPGPI